MKVLRYDSNDIDRRSPEWDKESEFRFVSFKLSLQFDNETNSKIASYKSKLEPI